MLADLGGGSAYVVAVAELRHPPSWVDDLVRTAVRAILEGIFMADHEWRIGPPSAGGFFEQLDADLFAPTAGIGWSRAGFVGRGYPVWCRGEALVEVTPTGL
ncbi:hypothetical protein [Nocardia sp. NPDC003963]